MSARWGGGNGKVHPTSLADVRRELDRDTRQALEVNARGLCPECGKFGGHAAGCTVGVILAGSTPLDELTDDELRKLAPMRFDAEGVLLESEPRIVLKRSHLEAMLEDAKREGRQEPPGTAMQLVAGAWSLVVIAFVLGYLARGLV